jgi:hypothetical protein
MVVENLWAWWTRLDGSKVLQDLIFVKLYYSAISHIVKLLYGYFPLSIMLIFTKVYQQRIITRVTLRVHNTYTMAILAKSWYPGSCKKMLPTFQLRCLNVRHLLQDINYLEDLFVWNLISALTLFLRKLGGCMESATLYII